MAMNTRLNETQLLALIENSSDAVSLLDEKLFPIYRNPAAYRITGYTLEERLKDNGVDQGALTLSGATTTSLIFSRSFASSTEAVRIQMTLTNGIGADYKSENF